MPSKKLKSNFYLAVWDIYGLESLFDLNKYNKELEDYKKDVMWKKLSGTDVNKLKPKLPPIEFLFLRARSNSHRHYEIYSFTTDNNIKESDVREWFAKCPQEAVDWIRINGNKLYSDRQSIQQVIK